MDEFERTEDLNPWHHREEFPDARQTALIPIAVLFGVACCAVPLSSGAGRLGRLPGVLLWLLLAVGLVLLNRRGKLGVWMAIGCSALLLSVRGWDVSLGVLVLATSVGAFSGAYLMSVTGKAWILLPICAAAGGVAYALLLSPWAVAVLFPVPAALLLGVSILREERRTTSVIYATGGVLLAFLTVAIWYFYNRFGAVRAEAVREAFAIWQDQTEQFFLGQYQTLRNALQPIREQAADAQSMETLDAIFSEASVREYVSELFALMPAFLLLLCGLPAFFAQKLLVGAYHSHHLTGVVSLESEVFEVGVPTAVLYGLAFLFTCFGSATTNLFFAVCENVCYLLLPVMCLVGIRGVPVLYRRFSPGMRVFALVAGIGLLLCNFMTLLSLLAFYGVVMTLTGAWGRHLRRQDRFDSFDGPDDEGED